MKIEHYALLSVFVFQLLAALTAFGYFAGVEHILQVLCFSACAWLYFAAIYDRSVYLNHIEHHEAVGRLVAVPTLLVLNLIVKSETSLPWQAVILIVNNMVAIFCCSSRMRSSMNLASLALLSFFAGSVLASLIPDERLSLTNVAVCYLLPNLVLYVALMLDLRHGKQAQTSPPQ